MPSVSVPLNHIARACARARADQRAFFAADKSADNRAARPADERALRPAVVMPAMTTLRETRAAANSEQQDESHNHRHDASIDN